MTDAQRVLIMKAHDSLAAARVLLSNGFPGFAASRAYYAMFYVAEAFLEGEGLSFSKHSGVAAAFGQHFARTGKVPAEFHRFLLDAQDVRLSADYDYEDEVDIEQAQTHIARAREFIDLAERLLGPLPPMDEQPA